MTLNFMKVERTFGESTVQDWKILKCSSKFFFQIFVGYYGLRKLSAQPRMVYVLPLNIKKILTPHKKTSVTEAKRACSWEFLFYVGFRISKSRISGKLFFSGMEYGIKIVYFIAKYRYPWWTGVFDPNMTFFDGLLHKQMQIYELWVSTK